MISKKAFYKSVDEGGGLEWGCGIAGFVVSLRHIVKI
jgi:hypothetical protein